MLTVQITDMMLFLSLSPPVDMMWRVWRLGLARFHPRQTQKDGLTPGPHDLRPRSLSRSVRHVPVHSPNSLDLSCLRETWPNHGPAHAGPFRAKFFGPDNPPNEAGNDGNDGHKGPPGQDELLAQWRHSWLVQNVLGIWIGNADLWARTAYRRDRLCELWRRKQTGRWEPHDAVQPYRLIVPVSRVLINDDDASEWSLKASYGLSPIQN